MSQDTPKMGIAGRLAATFQTNPMTPLLALLGLLMGIFAIMVTPKEEDPQIEVTFIDVFIPFVGATPQEVQNLVTLPAEQLISEIKGIDTLYSMSQADGAMLIVVFDVGVPRNDAIVALYNQLYANMDRLPRQAGVGEPLIKPRSIDDVPIVNINLWSKDRQVSAAQLTQVATGLKTQLKRIPGTREVNLVGEQELVLNVRIDPVKLNAFGLSYDQLQNSLDNNNRTSMPVSLVQNNQVIKIKTGQFLQSEQEVADLVVAVVPTQSGPQAVYLADIAELNLGADIPSANVWFQDSSGSYPSVTLSIAKQPGINAVDLADAINAQLQASHNVLIPDNIQATITRNYGETAAEKSSTLIYKLMFATLAVVLLVLVTMGLRESIVVGVAIIITLAMTLFASWAWGFTLNRISLFALIFSIGILVDDAIVVVENIHRHMAMKTGSIKQLIPRAVDEVGGPTILATFTVIAALLPMNFVGGLMGPYMSPIPINASMGMLISLAIAFIITPWLSGKLLASSQVHATSHNPDDSGMARFFHRLLSPFVIGDKARTHRRLLSLGLLVLIVLAMSLPVAKLVVMKMLPFDNKSEFQVMLDMPEGTPVEQTQKVLNDLGQYLLTVPEVTHIQTYAGTNSPMNFNGLVRHYYLREAPELGDIQVNLVAHQQRDRDSHSIAASTRAQLTQIASRYNGRIQVVEVPPGPPVWAPVVAEVYAPNEALRQQAAKQMFDLFEQTDGMVDVEIFLPAQQAQWQISIDRQKANLLGVPYANIVDAITTSIGGKDVANFHQPNQQTPIPIRLELKESTKMDLEQVLNLTLTNQQGTTVAIADLVNITQGHIKMPIMHKNMVPMIMVTGDMAGELDSPLYGMFDMVAHINGDEGLGFQQSFVEQPSGLDSISVLWDGEWKITYETFRDMGIAYAIGMIGIYLLVVAQFKSYLVPLVIMAPIPLTIIGVMPGHALLGAQFTAPSMIGMIALAGIIVRNSILLVDFINHELARGIPLAQAVIHSGTVRAKPIILTALAAMIGSLFILDDPIFNGLAISLIFGIFASTLLTIILIPVLYFSLIQRFPEIANKYLSEH
ncbi:efflux RND transporter permease subunit [Shewanella sp. NIFS-20-20]|uniref:efflux RND transporter permease subunit n=1 Tax=Shewanella sp. NIFS-20-20 TaxID=2853806 RepID=UPI001C486A8F|nr:efflux RND transporter permease subunit [Shewanella sp. NIFS-20-20]MBV7314996.1 efflux RND transporter permease subunit [Shewanella sp. NIFS-20-20]